MRVACMRIIVGPGRPEAQDPGPRERRTGRLYSHPARYPVTLHCQPVDSEPPGTGSTPTWLPSEPGLWLSLQVHRSAAFLQRVALAVSPRLKGRTQTRVASPAQLEDAIRGWMREGNLSRAAGRLLLRAMSFPRLTAADVMVPRTDIQALPVTANLQQLFELAAVSRHSRFLIFGQDLDDVLGVAGLRDACRVPAELRTTCAVDVATRPALVVPTMTPLPQVLAQLRRDPASLAVVVDEYGGTAGLVTLHDVLEEVAGEVDAHAGRVRALSPPLRGWVVPGVLRDDELEEEVGLRLPRGEYDTIAGYVMDRLGRLPEPGDAVEAKGWTLRVHRMEGTRVASVLALPPDTGSQS